MASEVKRIMHPLPSSDEPCFSGSTSSISIQRRNVKRRKKGLLKCIKQTPTFQKKLVVFKYMGEQPPQSFNRKENDILLRGLLPEIAIDAKEIDVREEIVQLLHNSKEFELINFDLNDFEFMDVHGKKAVVPTCGKDHEFTGKAVKQVAGVGAVYIRLTKKIPGHILFMSDDSDFEPSAKFKNTRYSRTDSDSSFELPPFSVPSNTGGSCSASINSVSVTTSTSGSTTVNTPGATAASTKYTVFSSTNLAAETIDKPPIDDVPISHLTSYCSTLLPPDELDVPLTFDQVLYSSPEVMYDPLPNSLECLQERFPFLSIEHMTTIFEVAGRSYVKTVNFLENCTLDNLLNLAYEYFIEFCTEESPKLRMTPDTSDKEMAVGAWFF